VIPSPVGTLTAAHRNRRTIFPEIQAIQSFSRQGGLFSNVSPVQRREFEVRQAEK
jgi:hypothetical protein